MKLLRKLLVPATVVASLLLTTPAWASWNTMDEGDPFQVVHSCHDGIVVDWAGDPVLYAGYKTYDSAAAVKAHDAALKLGTDHDVLVYVANSSGNPLIIGHGSREIPYNPTVLGGFSETVHGVNEYDGTRMGQYIHLLEGQHTYLYDGSWQATTTPGSPGGVDMTDSPNPDSAYFAGYAVDDCYVAAPLAVVRTTPNTTQIALRGSFYLNVSKLPASSFTLTAPGALLGTKPTASSVRDVTGDGLKDLVLTYPVGLGAGRNTYTVTGTTSTGGFFQGHFIHLGAPATGH